MDEGSRMAEGEKAKVPTVHKRAPGSGLIVSHIPSRSTARYLCLAAPTIAHDMTDDAAAVTCVGCLQEMPASQEGV